MNIRKANNDVLNEIVRLLLDDKLGSKREDYKIPLPTEYLNTFSYKKPNFWVREKKQSSAKVDLVYPFKDMLIPIEIQSGKTGNLKSLHQFVDQSVHKYAVRIYGGKFTIEEARTPTGTDYLLMNLPYYLGTYIEGYLEYFIENY